MNGCAALITFTILSILIIMKQELLSVTVVLTILFLVIPLIRNTVTEPEYFSQMQDMQNTLLNNSLLYLEILIQTSGNDNEILNE